jgi:DNA-binding NarL/FixJ family response regulator
MNQKQIALVSGQDNQAWYKDLKDAVLPLGGVIEIINILTITKTDWGIFDLVFLDLATIQDPIETISQIQDNDPNIKIIVFSPVPRWKQAREMMHAGVTDYLIRSGEKDYLQTALKPRFDQ